MGFREVVERLHFDEARGRAFELDRAVSRIQERQVGTDRPRVRVRRRPATDGVEEVR